MAFTDDFTGDNDDLLEDRSGWTLVRDGGYTCKIYGNAICFKIGGGGSGVSVWVCTDQGSANHYVQIKQTEFSARSDLNCAARLVDYQNCISYSLQGTGSAGSRLRKIVAGAVTELVQTQGALNDVAKVTCEGNTIKFYLNASQEGTDQTVTDHNTETSSGLLGGQAIGSLTYWDDFEAGPMATPAAYIPKVIMIN